MPRQPEDNYLKTSRLRFHYLDWNGRNERILVMLHGIGDNAHIWDHVARGVSDHLRVIAPDQRGHGWSDWPSPPAYTCEDYVADLEAFIDGLGLDRVILLGHSMGALHATRYASLHPERVSGLVHVDIEARPPEWNKKYLSNLYEQLPHAYETLKECVDQTRKNSPYADDALLLSVARQSLTKGDDGKFRHRFDREVLFHFDRYDLRSCLKNIRCPALMIRGEESRVMSEPVAREMSLEIPGGRFEEIPRAAHPVHTDNPRIFEKTVLHFLRSNDLL
jgi:pimeloyl-ACP methyl ester carboxylesterase